MNKQIHEEVTAQIIAFFEDASIKDESLDFWATIATSLPKNAKSQEFYNGINILLLWIAKAKLLYTFDTWLTFKQAISLGGKVKKGAKAVKIIIYKRCFKNPNGKHISKETYNALPDAIKINCTVYGMIKYAYLFNLDCIEGLPSEYYLKANKPEPNIWEQNEIAEQIAIKSGANIQYKEQNEAFYVPALDLITLPTKEQFYNDLNFYSVLFHELVHWTGDASRLNRNFENDTKNYAFEELVAELGSAFICSALGYTNHLRTSAKYLQHWLKALKSDTNFIFKAASEASKAFDYLNADKCVLLNSVA